MTPVSSVNFDQKLRSSTRTVQAAAATTSSSSSVDNVSFDGRPSDQRLMVGTLHDANGVSRPASVLHPRTRNTRFTSPLYASSPSLRENSVMRPTQRTAPQFRRHAAGMCGLAAIQGAAKNVPRRKLQFLRNGLVSVRNFRRLFVRVVRI